VFLGLNFRQVSNDYAINECKGTFEVLRDFTRLVGLVAHSLQIQMSIVTKLLNNTQMALVRHYVFLHFVKYT
jgi:hypothetical protein